MILAVLASALLMAQPAPAVSLQQVAYRGRGSSLAPNPHRKPRVHSTLKPHKPKQTVYPKSRSKCGVACSKGGGAKKPRAPRH